MATRVITTFINREPDRSKHSAAYKIFHYEWHASVPKMFLYSEEYMRISGTVISDASYDAIQPRQMVEGRYTIAQLAVLLDEGATIQITNPEDTKAIYDIVADHLEDWSKRVTIGSAFDLKSVPHQDMMQMSQLADHLLGFAKRYVTHERPRNSLVRRLEQIRGRAGLNTGRRYRDPDAPTPETEKPKLREHSEFVDNILQHGNGRNSWS